MRNSRWVSARSPVKTWRGQKRPARSPLVYARSSRCVSHPLSATDRKINPLSPPSPCRFSILLVLFHPDFARVDFLSFLRGWLPSHIFRRNVEFREATEIKRRLRSLSIELTRSRCISILNYYDSITVCDSLICIVCFNPKSFIYYEYLYWD